MPCQKLPDEITHVNDDVFSYMCNLAMEKCSRKAEKKKASCGGAAMRKRLLIKNFVAQMLVQDRQSKELTQSESIDQQRSTDYSSPLTSSSDFTSHSEIDNSGIKVEINGTKEEEAIQIEKEDESELDTSSIADEEEQDTTEEDTTDAGIEDEHTTLIIKGDMVRRLERYCISEHGNSKKQEMNGKDEAAKNEEEDHRIDIDFTNEEPTSLVGYYSDLSWKQMDDDFHKVPIPNTLHAELIDEDNLPPLSLPIAPMNVMEEQRGWQFYDEPDAYGLNYQIHQQQYITTDFPESIIDESSDLILGKNSEISEKQHMVGLVNLVSNTAGRFGYDNVKADHIYQQKGHRYLDLDAVVEQDIDEQQRLLIGGSRKRPWSLIYAADEEIPLAPSIVDNNANPATLLSPLCCGIGMLQFGTTANDSLAANGPPIMKRVKL